MIKIFVYSCLLSALSIVEMSPLNIDGRVGKNVTIKCSDWNVWTYVKSNDKYLCDSPCTKDKHIIIKAAFGKTTHKNRIELTNSAEGLFVTFTNLQKSDSKRYYCGVEKLGYDSLIQVNLKVTEDESSSLKTTPTTVIAGSTLSVSSDGSPMITDMSTSNIIHSSTTTTTSSATQGAGCISYLIIGVIVIITILMVLLKLMRKMMKKQPKEEEEEAREHVEYDEIQPEDQQTVSQPAAVSTSYFSADPDSLYANYSYHQDTELEAESGNNYSKDFSLNSASSPAVYSKVAYAGSRVTDPLCDLVYSVAQLPKVQIEPTGQSEPNHSESNENDSLYSLAQLPRAS